MYDNYNYPMGADNENAPWNQSDADFLPVEIGIKFNATIESVQPVKCGYKVTEEDEDGYYTFNEKVDDWKEIAREEFEKPDLKWKPADDCNYYGWVLLKIVDKGRKRYETHYRRCGELPKYEDCKVYWQCINEFDYEIDIDGVEDIWEE